VHHAVVHARGGGQSASHWIGVTKSCQGGWFPSLAIPLKDRAFRHIRWGVRQSVEEAARQADCGLLAIHGLCCATNFPGSLYIQQQLESAGQYAIRRGVEAARVETNLEAVAKVCGWVGATWGGGLLCMQLSECSAWKCRRGCMHSCGSSTPSGVMKNGMESCVQV
jgi:hypothetical protein